MTSKEMEQRSGVPRANIRYYEAQGLLTPQRGKNGYRAYSQGDLETLEKIKLLRRLGISVEELRNLRQGTEDLSAVLDRRLAELGGEQAAVAVQPLLVGQVLHVNQALALLNAGIPARAVFAAGNHGGLSFFSLPAPLAPLWRGW